MSRRVLFDSSVYIQAHDTIIALSARRHGIGVVTLNRAHFDLISEFRPVRILLSS